MYARVCSAGRGKKRLAAAVLLLAFLWIAGSSISGFAGSRAAGEESYKYYTSIAIQKGDTLWGIASRNITPEYSGIEEYMTEIRRLNRIYDDGIYAGAYLTIPYFREQ